MPQERRNSDYREAGRRSRSSSPAPRRRRSAARSASFAVLYAVAVIGVSALLACVGWIAASDVLALNKEEKTVTITITSEDSFGDVVDRLKEEAQSGDLIMTIGAGDIYKLGEHLVQALERRN